MEKLLSFEKMEALYKNLKNYQHFSYARKILALLRKENPRNLKLCQQHALCTYKDPDLPDSLKFDLALRILQEVEDIDRTKNQETLGLLGAIFKRKWKYDNQLKNLQYARSYYRRGHEEWKRKIEAGEGNNDDGYNSINYAFVLDLLGFNIIGEADRIHSAREEAEDLFEKARTVRRHIVGFYREEKAPALWLLATMAEAYFGLQQFEQASKYLADYKEKRGGATWEFETTARQLASVAEIQAVCVQLEKGEVESRKIIADAKETLEEFLEEDAGSIDTIFRGKVGLALSGGGFRAALYHIGVLARLAELDILRQVEVLSCVSGGSIIGACYYLKVKKMLEKKEDDAIDRTDYTGIVREIEREFLEAVQRNLRMRVFANLGSNFRMAFSDAYSRTNRLGELYEQFLYRKLNPEGGKGRQIRMKDLLLRSVQGQPDFNYSRDNWRRHNKVPNLVVNATAVNTGHNWQFTASWMGEPPGNIVQEVDARYRLRRMYYHQAPDRYQNFPLKNAVAASSCVPGLFDPLPLPGLYPDVDLQLVDGGVHDNQGIASLLEQDCTVLLVSDASGQLETEELAAGNPLSVLFRTNSILMERIRESQFLDLKNRRYSALIKGLFFIHLKSGLHKDPLNWAGSTEPAEALWKRDVSPEDYGIPAEIQEKLARIRTDLDTFNDAEAYALMYSGYRMAKVEYDRQLQDLFPATGSPKPEDWQFLQIEGHLEDPEKRERLEQLLAAGQSLFFKVFRLSRGVRIAGFLCLVPLVLLTAYLIYLFWNYSLVTVGGIALVVLGWGMAKLFGNTFVQIADWKGAVEDYLKKSGMAVLAFLVSRFYIHVLDRVYLRKGRVDKE
jgi:predicted acylesterase/phospholipase RssA